MTYVEEFLAMFDPNNLAQFMQWFWVSFVAALGSIISGKILLSKTNQCNVREVGSSNVDVASYYTKLFLGMLVFINLALGGYCASITFEFINDSNLFHFLIIVRGFSYYRFINIKLPLYNRSYYYSVWSSFSKQQTLSFFFIPK